MQPLIVNAPNGLRIRRLPEYRSDPLDGMPNGMIVHRLDDVLWNENWFKIRADFSDRYRVVGYSHRNYLNPVVTAEKFAQAEVPVQAEPDLPSENDGLYSVTASSLRLRDAPGTHGNVLSHLPRNRIVERVEDSNHLDWWKIAAKTGNALVEGYVSNAYLAPLAPQPAPETDLSLLTNITDAMNRVKRFVGDGADELDEVLLRKLNEIVAKYNINTTPRRFSHFMAQLAHESQHFTVLEENLNYSAEGLMSTFSNYFKSYDHAKEFERQPEQIANYVYANRMSNGNEASGDGYRFRGRGYIQLTGRENYEKASHRIGIDLVSNPDIVSTNRELALEVAADYWNSRNLNTLADTNDVKSVTKKINGGFNGLEDRKSLLQRAKSIWGG